MDKAHQTKQSKQSKQAYTAQIAGSILRKQSGLGSTTKLTAQQATKKADSSSKTRQPEEPTLK